MKSMIEHEIYQLYCDLNENFSDDTFEKLYKAVAPKITQFISVNYGVDDAEIENVLQDVFLILYRNIKSSKLNISDERRLWSYLKTLAKNKVRDRRRHRDDYMVDEAIEDIEANTMPHSVMDEEHISEKIDLVKILDKVLTHEQKTLVEMSLEGYKPKEIAEATGISIVFLYQKLQYATTKLKKYLKELEESSSEARDSRD